MQRSAAVSLALHVAAIVVATVGLPVFLAPPRDIRVPIPVDIVEISDVTNVAREAPAASAAPPDDAEPMQRASPPATESSSKAAAEAAPAPPAKPERLAAVAPVPKPAPPAPPAETRKAPPLPRTKPRPPRRDLDLDEIAALLDKRLEPAKAPAAPQPAPPKEVRPEPAPLAAIGDQPLTLSERDALRRQIEQCWILDPGVRDAAGLVVRVRIVLRRNGSLAEPPSLVDDTVMRARHGAYYQAAADRAIRAVLQCQPFRLPDEKYGRWRETELTFDPSEMMR